MPWCHINDIYGHCCSHYIVPELGPDAKFSYASHKAVNEYKEAKAVSWLYPLTIYYFFIVISSFHFISVLVVLCFKFRSWEAHGFST